MARPKGSKDQIKRKARKCSKTLEMVGKKFFRLTVLGITRKGKSPRIQVQCDCGIIKEISAYDIHYRKVLSCGCFHREEMTKRQIKPNNHSAKMKVFNSYKAGAKNRNLSFELEFDELIEICGQNCYYCDKLPSMNMKLKFSSFTYNGIDRVDNSKGYIKTNCVPCCHNCNFLKKSVSKEIILKASESFKNV